MPTISNEAKRGVQWGAAFTILVFILVRLRTETINSDAEAASMLVVCMFAAIAILSVLRFVSQIWLWALSCATVTGLVALFLTSLAYLMGLLNYPT